MVTEGNFPQIQPQAIQPQIEQYLELTKQASALKQAILEWAAANLALSEFIGKPGEFYLGPDVDNQKLILSYGNSADAAIQQMKTDGVRSRKQLVKPTQSTTPVGGTKPRARKTKVRAVKQPTRTVRVFENGKVVSKPYQPAPKFKLTEPRKRTKKTSN